jgi:hypothetical protein
VAVLMSDFLPKESRRCLDDVVAQVARLPRLPDAIEAVWDGDSRNWSVVLRAVTAEPRDEAVLTVIRPNGDPRAFDYGAPLQVAVDANAIGEFAASQLGIPFRFVNRDSLHAAAGRWLGSAGEDPATGLSGNGGVLAVEMVGGWIRFVSVQPDGAVRVLGASDQVHGLLYVASLEALGWKCLVEELEDLVNAPQVTERQLQEFFERNPRFLCGDAYQEARSHIILEREGSGPLIPDFVLRPHGTDALCDLLELKLPDAKLVVGRSDRRRLSSAVYEACAQLREYRSYFDDKSHREAVQEVYGLRLFLPRMIVLIGKRSDYPATDLRRAEADIPQLTLVTYDDLIERARSRIRGRRAR